MTLLATVESGTLAGTSLRDGGVRRFLGIPYGASPINELRWKAPQPVQPWKGTRDATRFGPGCIQNPPPRRSLYYGGTEEFSEDCLNLNVWTGPEEAKGRPVMVWFHFGAYQFGSASNPVYDGEHLATLGTTVVSVNHRLGRLGFLAHPELSSEAEYGTSGNYGLLDQIAALQWVQRNINSFGGDPDNVTLVGVSAGGNSIHFLRSSPLAMGLFHKAVVQSGPGLSLTFDGPGHPSGAQTRTAGEQAGSELTEILGVSSIDELRALPIETVLSTPLPRVAGPWSFDLVPEQKVSLNIFDSGYPIIDGYVLPESPLDAYSSGRVADIPMIVGNVANEWSGLPYLTTLADYESHLRSEFGDRAEEVLGLYPATTDEEAVQASWQLESDRIFVWPTITSARLHAENCVSPVFHYRFAHQPPIPTTGIIEAVYAGAFHSADVTYVFGSLDSRDWAWTNDDRQLSASMSAAWTAFARTGDPNTEDVPEWPTFQVDEATTLQWGVMPSLGHVHARDRMKLLDMINELY